MKKYIEKYRIHMVLVWVLALLIHGGKLYTEAIGIDTEDLIHLGNDFYGGWLHTGRQGLVALKWLTDSLRFRPFISGIVTLLLLGLCVSGFFLLWGSFFEREDLENGRETSYVSVFVWVLSGWLILSHPVLTEQLYFSIQSVEICVGILVVIVALGLIVSYNSHGGKWKLPVSAILLLLPFSIYQSMVVLFIFGTVSVLVSKALCQLENHQSSKMMREVFPFLVVFVAAFGTNMLITKLFFSSSDYLGEQILWGKYDFKDNLRAIAGHILKVFTGYKSVHFNPFFGALSVCFCGMAVFLCVKRHREQKENTGGNDRSGIMIAKLLFYVAALFFTPFLMTFLCGGSPVIRSQIVIPFLTGFLTFGCMKQFAGRKNIFPVLVIAVSIAGAWVQSNVTEDFYYTDRMRYDQDAYLGRELIQEIQAVSGEEEYPVVVIGRKPFQGNNSCLTGEIFGKSFFDHDVEVEPVYYWSTRRVLGFLHTLGGDFNQIPMEWTQTAVSDSKDMPAWPAEGSVAVKDNMVIIKLSETEE